MKLANKMGSISKMKDTPRRRPWRVRVTTGWEFDEVLMKQKQVQKVLGYYATQQEAMKALSSYLDSPFDIDVLTVTFDECYTEASRSFTEGRRRNYEAAYKYLEPIKDLPIRTIKANQMQKCIDSCTTTQQQEIATVCHKVFDYALKNEIIDRDPSRYLRSTKIEPTIKREMFTPELVNDLWDLTDEWWAKLILMLLYSGMRTKELKDLDPDNIMINSATLSITVAKNKSSVRQIPIHSHVLALFDDYKAAGSNLYGYTHDGLNKALKSFCGHTAHDCRHTFATRMRECGCNPLVLQKILGHTPQTITERVYTHLTLTEMKNNLELLKY